MKKLSPDAHALIAAGRKRAQPSIGDRERVGEKLAASVPAFGALVATTRVTAAAAQTAAPAVTAASGVAGGVAGKIVAIGLLAAVTAVTATTILIVSHDERPAVQRPLAATSVRNSGEPRAAAVDPVRSAAPSVAARPSESAPNSVASAGLDPPGAPSRPVETAPAPERGPAESARTAEQLPLVRGERESGRDASPRSASARLARAEAGGPPLPSAAATSPVTNAPLAAPLPAIEPAVAVANADLPKSTGETAEALPRVPPVHIQADANALAPELLMLDTARSALHAGDPASTLRLVELHAALYAASELVPERLALRGLALCALHREGAARRAVAELEQHAPGSALAAGVRKACGAEPRR